MANAQQFESLPSLLQDYIDTFYDDLPYNNDSDSTDNYTKETLKSLFPSDREYSIEENKQIIYRFYSCDTSPNYMLVFQNPAATDKPKEKRKRKETGQLVEAGANPEEMVKVSARFFTLWLNELWQKDSYPHISEVLKKIVDNLDIDYSGDIEEYCQVNKLPDSKDDADPVDYVDKIHPGNGLFNDFYVTDLVKAQMTTQQNTEAMRELSLRYLKREIELVNPDVIFCFSKRTWEPIRDDMDSDKVDDESVSKVHGKVYDYKGAKLIPLCHFTGSSWFVRNAYIDYLEKGLEQLDL